MNKETGESFPEKKYYDTYLYEIDEIHYNRRILGDATGEMGPFANATYGSLVRQISSWYSDEAWFVCSVIPWFYRGGGYNSGMDAGSFASGFNYGSVHTGLGFRIVLAI